MEEGTNVPATPGPSAGREGEGEDGSYSAWEAADVHSPPATPATSAWDVAADIPSPPTTPTPALSTHAYDARHSSDSFSSASTHATHEGGDHHTPLYFPFGGKDASPLSPPPPEVDSPPTSEEGCASKMLACCNSPYVKDNARVRAFVLALPQDAVCKFFTRLTTRLVLTVPKMVLPMVRSRTRGIPKKWSAGRILGRGAFGECSLAMDHDTGRLLAVKRIQLVGSAREVADSVKALRQEVEVDPRKPPWSRVEGKYSVEFR